MEKSIILEIREASNPQKNDPRTLRTLARSVKTLSEDLYTKDTHFIFELIQNAEDNTYDESVSPFLRFVITNSAPSISPLGGHSLIIENNEVGFQKENVNAICDVNNSTKTQDQGYIGEKGIGFKSVFRVTSCPYIFSNGFQFSLPEEDKFSGLGYIVPSWESSIPNELNKNITSIHLPLDKEDFPVNKVVDSLKDIAPETIVFLKQLSAIELAVKQEEPYEVIIEKDTSEFPLVRLSYLKRDKHEECIEEQLFWVTTKNFHCPEEAKHEKRTDVEFREVSIAIPLTEKPQGKLFAYLPVWEDTGLPFLINADFLLVSSRESVKEGIGWNDWLRSCIADVYAEALISCLTSEQLSFEERIKAYASIPVSCKHQYLEPVVVEIQEKLKEIPIVYTHHSEELSTLDSSRITSKEFWKLLEDGDLPLALKESVCVVRRELQPYHKTLRTLGVVSLGNDDILACLDDNVWLNTKSDEWFLNLYRYLEKLKNSNQSLTSKKIVKILSDRDKRSVLSCSKEQPVYFEQDKKSILFINDAPKWLSQKISAAFLDKNFWSLLSNQKDTELITTWMTTNLSVYAFSKKEYFADTVKYLANKSESLSIKEIIEVTSFLVEYSNDDFDQWSTLPLVLNNGVKVTAPHFHNNPIIVPENYDDASGWQNIWKTEDERQHFMVLSSYYNTKTVDYLLEKLKGILRKYPEPFKYEVDRHYSRYSDFKAPTWMTESVVFGPKEIQSLLAWVKQNENSSYLYVYWDRPDGRYNFTCRERRAAQFQQCLAELPWLPTSKGKVPPSQAFLRKKSIEEVFGNTVPYVDEDLPHQSIELLGVKDELTLDDLLGILVNRSGKADVNQNMVHKIYFNLLSRVKSDKINWQNDELLRLLSDGEFVSEHAKTINAAFLSERLIFTPNTKTQGTWYSLQHVIWEDSEKVLGDDFAYLQKYYPDLKEFFVDVLGIKGQASSESFAERWIKIQAESTLSPSELTEILEPIYKVLLPITKDVGEKPVWWNEFIRRARILSQEWTFPSPKKMVIPDDGGLKKIFAKTNVEFVWRPEKDSFNHWAPFYESFNIPRISELVKISLVSESNFKRRERNSYVTPSMIEMLASWLREKDEKRYKTLFEKNVFHNLRDLCEAEVSEEIKILFSLQSEELNEEIEGEYPVFWDQKNGLLIINQSAKESDIKYMVSDEIAKGLVNNSGYKDLATWVELILCAKNTERLQRKGWPVPKEIRRMFKDNLELSRGDSKRKENTPLESEEENALEDTVGRQLNSEHQAEPQQHGTLCEENTQEKSLGNQEDRNFGAGGNNKGISKSQPSEDIANGEDAESKNRNLNDIGENEEHVSRKNEADKINEAFNRAGKTSLSDDFEDNDYYNPGRVKNPTNRRNKFGKKISGKIAEEPVQAKRRQETVRSILEPSDATTREYLLRLYSGKCQICGNTFAQRDGMPFFISKYIVERKHARFFDNPANALCLCPLHFAQWKHGAVEAENIQDQILAQKTKAEGGTGDIFLKINLCGKDCKISYKEKHIVDLQALISELVKSSL